jgi:hypothetical protein
MLRATEECVKIFLNEQNTQTVHFSNIRSIEFLYH